MDFRLAHSIARIKQHCKKYNITLEHYEQQLKSGMKWCCGCKAFHNRTEFWKDSGKWDGLNAVCNDFFNEARRKKTRRLNIENIKQKAERQNPIPHIMRVDKSTTPIQIQNQ